jgi:hypothetical protein
VIVAQFEEPRVFTLWNASLALFHDSYNLLLNLMVTSWLGPDVVLSRSFEESTFACWSDIVTVLRTRVDPANERIRAIADCS